MNLHTTQTGLQYHGSPATFNLGRINLAYFTSFRELGLDEQVGRIITDPQNGASYGYRMGNLESMACMITQNHNPFATMFNLTAIFCDDNDNQFAEAWQSQIYPDHAVPIRDSQGNVISIEPLEQMMIRIPSTQWRRLRGAEKAEAKSGYEREIIAELESRGVDLIISDSYVSIFGPTMLEAYGGRILNIHPAITRLDNPNRLPGITPTRDAYTRARYGFIIVDDKKESCWPAGEATEVEYHGEKRKAIMVNPHDRTGVTVHVVDELIDHGEVIMDIEETHVTPQMTMEGIRARNYQLKLAILPLAMMQYVQRPEVRAAIQTSRMMRDASD